VPSFPGSAAQGHARAGGARGCGSRCAGAGAARRVAGGGWQGSGGDIGRRCTKRMGGLAAASGGADQGILDASAKLDALLLGLWTGPATLSPESHSMSEPTYAR